MPTKSTIAAHTGQRVSGAMKRFMISLLADAMAHPGNLESGKKHLKAYCENERLNYRIVERDLDLFFGLLADYRIINSVVLYHFLRLQAQFCYVDKDAFDALPLAAPNPDSLCEEHALSSYRAGADLLSSDNVGGMVGGHLIGL